MLLLQFNQQDVVLDLLIDLLNLNHRKLLKPEPFLACLSGRLRVAHYSLALTVSEVANASKYSVLVKKRYYSLQVLNGHFLFNQCLQVHLFLGVLLKL